MPINETADAAAKAVEEKIDAAREVVGDRKAWVKEKMTDVTEGVKARAASLRDKIRDTDWDDVMSNVKGYVRDNPGKSVAIAMGVGFALGLLLRRRSDD